MTTINSANPIETIENSPMTWRQIVVIAIGIFVSALDGFDLTSISFAAPGIADEWGIGRDSLGLLLSMEMVGIGVGALMLGRFADRYGRKILILICMCVMAAGMFLASTAEEIISLSLFRIFTGVGLGGMFTSITAMIAESSNKRNRSMVVSLTTGGIALGTICGGLIATELLKTHSWRAIFQFGGYWSLLTIPLVMLLVPESVAYLFKSEKSDRLERVNKSLKLLGFKPVSDLPSSPSDVKTHVSWGAILSPKYQLISLVLMASFFCFSMAMYFYTKWIPKLGVDLGLSPSTAGSILVWGSLGGVIGALCFSIASRYFVLRWLVVTALIGSSVGISSFGFVGPNFTWLVIVAVAGNFFIGGSSVTFYALFASAYPVELRATGMGFILGLARGGAALGPYVGGVLLASGAAMGVTTSTLASCALVAALLLIFVLGNRLEGSRDAASH